MTDNIIRHSYTDFTGKPYIYFFGTPCKKNPHPQRINQQNDNLLAHNLQQIHNNNFDYFNITNISR